MQIIFVDDNQYMKGDVLLRKIVRIIDELDLIDYDEIHAFSDIYETILKEFKIQAVQANFYNLCAVTDFMTIIIKSQIPYMLCATK